MEAVEGDENGLFFIGDRLYAGERERERDTNPEVKNKEK
jgi:hypothetical protein